MGSKEFDFTGKAANLGVDVTKTQWFRFTLKNSDKPEDVAYSFGLFNQRFTKDKTTDQPSVFVFDPALESGK